MITTLKNQILKKRNNDKINFLYKKLKDFTEKPNYFFQMNQKYTFRKILRSNAFQKVRRYLEKIFF
jgi:hypothetical protein